MLPIGLTISLDVRCLDDIGRKEGRQAGQADEFQRLMERKPSCIDTVHFILLPWQFVCGIDAVSVWPILPAAWQGLTRKRDKPHLSERGDVNITP